MEEKVLIQHQSSSATIHSGLFVVGWQVESDRSESITVANLTPAYASQSSAEIAQGADTSLAEELANTSIVTRSNFFGGYVIVESSGSDLRTVASNLVASIKALGDNWYAVLITS